MIRPAKFIDIPEIVALLHRAFLRSHYARDGVGEIDVKEAKRLLVESIRRHGLIGIGGTYVMVSETAGMIRGLILGTLHRVYSIGNRLMATDLFWVADEDVEPADPYRLMKGMIEWASAAPAVAEIRCGTTAAIAVDPGAAGVILKRLGLVEYGNLYRKTC